MVNTQNILNEADKRLASSSGNSIAVLMFFLFFTKDRHSQQLKTNSRQKETHCITYHSMFSSKSKKIY